MSEGIQAYKGFDEDMRCGGRRYEVGKSYYHVAEVVVGYFGFHACEKASDVWKYSGPVGRRYARVEMSGVIRRNAEDSQIAASSIRIVEEISPEDFIAAVIEELRESPAAGSSGAVASSDGFSRIVRRGAFPRIATSGCSFLVVNSGTYGQIAGSGDSTRVVSTGRCGQIASSGDHSQIASIGADARIVSSGNDTAVDIRGENSVFAATGERTRAKGRVGTWLALAEINDGKCVGFATGCIGQDGLEPDVFYQARDGKLVRA